ncbi:flagellar basal-body MS-ring/collar protein FliF [Bacillus sp. FJAT-29814]|uniref:flagellar basal-body MS-ring/collar protein FliF n=1 Tax=Bacillus sp. FJAT-29814 TaxID=1729688 RepID=UPI00082DAA0F|nr:flagellar basal-body MS-ring/collar protein FliF [Bacillus sp. FJAT-29814]
MNQKIIDSKEKFSQFWKNASKKNKTLYIGTFILLVAILSLTIFFMAKPNLVPLYANPLTQKEIGEIKGVLEKQGVTDYKITNNGTQILVPSEVATDLVVNLAAAGYPKGGPISFSEQTKDLKFGVTDRELDAIEREVIQGQLANLMTKISGVKHAEVMITLPKESVFIRPAEEGKASASIIVDLEPGYELEKKQIKALYHLASKSIPDLPEENIVITDQNGQLLGLTNSEDAALEGVESYETQRDIKQKIEADIQRSIQQLLGTMLGQDKVLVQTFVKLNFDKVKTQQNLVEPLNEDKGIAVSVEEVTKSYSGEGAVPGGVGETGEGDVPAYAASGSTGKNDYEEKVNRVNYEVNRITKEMVESPYSIEDLTINVGVEPPNPKNPASLTPETEENIRNILANVVRTAIKDNNNLTEADLNNRITVFPREFAGKKDLVPAQADEPTIDSYLNYIWIGAAALALLLGGLVTAALVRRKKKNELELASEFLEVKKLEEFESGSNKKESVKKELTELAGKNTEEFVDLLRYWLKEEKEG